MVGRVIRVVRQVFAEFFADKCMRMAAALSFYTVFSLPPLLVVVTSIAGAVFDPNQVTQLVTQEFREVLGDDVAAQIEAMIQQANLPNSTFLGGTLGIALLLFGATGVLAQLQNALNEVWNVRPNLEAKRWWRLLTKRLVSLGLLLSLAFLLMVSLLSTMILNRVWARVRIVFPQFWQEGALEAANWGVSYVGIALLFAALYKYLPDRKVAWRQVWFAAALAALLFMLAKWGLGIYLGRSEIASAYGVAASLALILMWIYYSGIIFLLGAEITQVLAQEENAPSGPARE